MPPSNPARGQPLAATRCSASVLSAIDAFNSAMGDYKLRAAKVLITLAENENTDAVERRRCASALIRAPFERYPNAAAINPDPPEDDDDSDDDGPDDGDPPPTPPADLMKAYDHGYWHGLSRDIWTLAKPTPDTIVGYMKDHGACHSPGRQNPLPPPNAGPGGADVPSADLHREAVEVNSRWLPRSGTPGTEPPPPPAPAPDDG
ncbi:MAG: hypothetical protein ACKVS8_09680 [Phycisphaerales bacterium]